MFTDSRICIARIPTGTLNAAETCARAHTVRSAIVVCRGNTIIRYAESGTIAATHACFDHCAINSRGDVMVCVYVVATQVDGMVN